MDSFQVKDETWGRHREREKASRCTWPICMQNRKINVLSDTEKNLNPDCSLAFSGCLPIWEWGLLSPLLTKSSGSEVQNTKTWESSKKAVVSFLDRAKKSRTRMRALTVKRNKPGKGQSLAVLGDKLPYVNTLSNTGLLNVSTTSFGRDKSVWKPVLCIARCLVASLASDHLQMPVVPFSCDNQKCLWTLSNIPFGDKITPSWKPVV